MKVYLLGDYPLGDTVEEWHVPSETWHNDQREIEIGGHWYVKSVHVVTSLEDAETIFNQMKEKKIKSMEKQLAAIKAKTFEVKKV